jgi:hypothetical protein
VKIEVTASRGVLLRSEQARQGIGIVSDLCASCSVIVAQGGAILSDTELAEVEAAEAAAAAEAAEAEAEAAAELAGM